MLLTFVDPQKKICSGVNNIMTGLQDGCSWVRMPVVVSNLSLLQNVHNLCKDFLAVCSMGSGRIYLAGKAAEESG